MCRGTGYLNDARDVIRPLYNNQTDKHGNFTGAPLLFEHRAIMLTEARSENFESGSFKRRSMLTTGGSFKSVNDASFKSPKSLV